MLTTQGRGAAGRSGRPRAAETAPGPKSHGRILVIDDDNLVVEALRVLLEHEGYAVLTAYDVHEGLRCAYRVHPELILLDVNFPSGDNGYTALERLREMTDAPIIMLTANTQPESAARGLDGGAVDYIRKPFERVELLSRIRRHLHDHRRRPNENLQVIDEHLTIDWSAHRVRVKGETVALTPIEWRLFACLAEAQGRIVTFEELLTAGWGRDGYDDTRAIKVRISAIRRKIHDSARPSLYIHAEREAGYRFEPLR